MTGLRATSPWFSSLRPNPTAALRLFCFPYAGGSAHVFHTWPEALPLTVEVCPVQLPGRGRRLLEAPFSKMTPLVQAVAQALLPHLERPFALFGHSMGAIISFELARHLRKEHGCGPLYLFVSGCQAPQIPATHARIYDLPEAEFLKELQQFNGTPSEVLEHPEMMQLVLPLLRSDFELAQTYIYSDDYPLNCPISVFGGLQDKEVSREQLEGWREQTTGDFSLQMLPGDHFFLHTEQQLLLEMLSLQLSRLASGSGRAPRL